MKIAFSICNMGFGHSTRSLNIIKELESRGHEIQVLVGKPYDDFFNQRNYNTTTLSNPINLYPEVGSRLMKTIKFSLETGHKFLSSTFNAQKIIKKFDPDILVSDSEIGSVLALNNIKKIMLTHQLELFVKEKFSKINKIWIKILNQCDSILVPDVLDLKIPKKINKKTEKIGPLFAPIKKSKKKLRKELGIKSKTILMLPSFATADKQDVINLLKPIDCNFILLGENKNKTIDNIILKQKQTPEKTCAYIKAVDYIVLSGYTSLMESVYYQKPVLLIPTQTEQKTIAKLGEKNNILMKGEFTKKSIKNFINNTEKHKRITNNQKKYHKNGTKQAADIIEKYKDSLINTKNKRKTV